MAYGNSTNSFMAFLPSTAATSISANAQRSFRHNSIQSGRGHEEQRRQDDPRHHVNRIVVSKINCSKNDERSVGEIDPKQRFRNCPARPPREDGEFGVTTRETVVMRRFQTVERTLHGVKKPESL